MPISPEEFKKKFAKERKLIEQGADPRYARKVLKALAPVYSYSPHDIYRIDDERDNNDLLEAAKGDSEIGHLLPTGLVIGGLKGLSYGSLLNMHYKDQKWWKEFRKHMDIYGEVVWVLPMRGSGDWVIHNTTVRPDRDRPAIVIPARKTGLNHVRVIRLELFIEEHKDE